MIYGVLAWLGMDLARREPQAASTIDIRLVRSLRSARGRSYSRVAALVRGASTVATAQASPVHEAALARDATSSRFGRFAARAPSRQVTDSCGCRIQGAIPE